MTNFTELNAKEMNEIDGGFPVILIPLAAPIIVTPVVSYLVNKYSK
jgi:bacteriocin-like protein